MALRDYTYVMEKINEYNGIIRGLPVIEKQVKEEKMNYRKMFFKENVTSRLARKNVIRTLEDKWNVQYSKALSIRKLVEYMATLDADLARGFVCQVLSLFENQEYYMSLVHLSPLDERWVIIPACQMTVSEDVLRRIHTATDLEQFLKQVRGVQMPHGIQLKLLDFYKCCPIEELRDFSYLYDAIYLLMEMRFENPELEISQIFTMVWKKLEIMAYSRVCFSR